MHPHNAIYHFARGVPLRGALVIFASYTNNLVMSTHKVNRYISRTRCNVVERNEGSYV